MIQVGDLVRIKNENLRPDLGSLFSRWRRSSKIRRADGSCKPLKYRGKQKIAKVLRIVKSGYNWRNKSWNTIVELDIPERHSFGEPRNMLISTDFLVVHRKGKSKPRGIVAILSELLDWKHIVTITDWSRGIQ
jgi:hypothetical protein